MVLRRERGRGGGCSGQGKGQGRNAVEKIERMNCDLSVDGVLTHCSLKEEGFGAPVARAGIGPSPRPGPASGEPSSTCGSHRLSSLLDSRWIEDENREDRALTGELSCVLHRPLLSLHYRGATSYCSGVQILNELQYSLRSPLTVSHNASLEVYSLQLLVT